MKEGPLWLDISLVIVAWCWFAFDVAKKFGWTGLLLKVALFIDCIFLSFVVAFHQPPWSALRSHHGHVDLYSVFWFWVVCFSVLIIDRPMRWFMRPTVRWVLISTAPLGFVAMYAGLKGWL